MCMHMYCTYIRSQKQPEKKYRGDQSAAVAATKPGALLKFLSVLEEGPPTMKDGRSDTLEESWNEAMNSRV